MVEELEVGRLVLSTAGRDAGTLYVVVGHQGPGTVLVADGRRRTTDQPKRKNPRHLRPAGDSEHGLPLTGGRRITDQMVQAAIEAARARTEARDCRDPGG